MSSIFQLGLNRINDMGIDFNKGMKNHNASCLLEALNDVIYTKYTRVNARDLRVVYIGNTT